MVSYKSYKIKKGHSKLTPFQFALIMDLFIIVDSLQLIHYSG